MSLFVSKTFFYRRNPFCKESFTKLCNSHKFTQSNSPSGKSFTNYRLFSEILCSSNCAPTVIWKWWTDNCPMNSFGDNHKKKLITSLLNVQFFWSENCELIDTWERSAVFNELIIWNFVDAFTAIAKSFCSATLWLIYTIRLPGKYKYSSDDEWSVLNLSSLFN